MKRSYLKRKTPLRKKSKSSIAQAKDRIQFLLREIGLVKDGGCVLRHFPVAGQCGGYRKDGELILQADHLITRAKTISYGDPRNIVILCKRHHGWWKPQNSRLYWEMIEDYVGRSRWAWIKKVEADQNTYHFTSWEWEKIVLMLEDTLKKLRVPTKKQIMFKFNKIKDGWKLLKDVSFKKPKGKLELVKITDYQVNTEEMLKIAKKENCLNSQRLAEYLLENPTLIPEEAKKFYLIFPGTVWQVPSFRQRVPHLIYTDEWELRFAWFDNDWFFSSYLVRFHKSRTKSSSC